MFPSATGVTLLVVGLLLNLPRRSGVFFDGIRFPANLIILGESGGLVAIALMGGKRLLYPVEPGVLPFMVNCFVDVAILPSSGLA